MVEHLPYEICSYFFQEAYRLLKNDGILRVEAPDAERLVEEYKKGNEYYFLRMLNNEELSRYGKSLHLHDVMVGQLSCYIENGVHVPVRIPKNEVDEKIETVSAAEFSDWCISFQTDEQRESGGHINTIYFEKLVQALKFAGFTKISQVLAGESSHSVMKKKLPGIERPHRGYFSVYVEAQK